MQNPRNYQEITQIVKHFLPGAQLQTTKTFRIGKEWLLELDFYPGPRRCLLSLSPQKHIVFSLEGSSKSLSAQAHPVQLYLRAHFQNKRLESWSLEDNEFSYRLCLRFLGAPHEIELRIPKKGPKLELCLKVPEKKDFVRTLPLAESPLLKKPSATSLPVGGRSADEDAQQVEVATPAQQKIQKQLEKKHRRLVKKVEADLNYALQWLESFTAICERVEANPMLWDQPEAWESSHRERIEAEMQIGKLPPWGESHIGRAQSVLFGERRRALRKKQGAEDRLREVLRLGVEALSTGERAKVFSQYEAEPAPGQENTKSLAQSSRRPQKKPGLWVPLLLVQQGSGAIWARVGRSATESAELFRQARDRDLWFHVRGEAGGHVWIPRGQAGFGAKGQASETLILEAAKLALWNSKLRKAGEGPVDFTERRYLKAMKGTAPGLLRIQRSETRFVRLDPEFESRLRGK